MAHHRSFLPALAALILLAGGWVAIGANEAHAQVFGPPMTVFGSVTDADGEVPEDLVVEAYVGNKVCGRGLTQFTGEGNGRVTVYYADVHSREQTSECGAPGVEVRIKIGERFADQTTQWRAGPVEMHVTFGDVTPAPIPTFTPTPGQATQAPTQPPAPATPTPPGPSTATATAGTSPSPSPTTTATRTATMTATSTPTLAGGLATREPVSAPNTGGDASDEGFPVWVAVMIGVGLIVALGGGIGFLMARNRGDDDEAES